MVAPDRHACDMIEKAFTLYGYVGFGLFFCLMPVFVQARPLASLSLRPILGTRGMQCLFLAFACACFWFSHGADNPPIFAAIALTSVMFAFHAGRFNPLQCIVLFAALFPVRTLPWWRQAEGPLYLTEPEVIELFSLWSLAIVVLDEDLTRRVTHLPMRLSQWWARHAHSAHLLAFLVFAFAASVLSFSTAVLKYPHHIYVAWHHWGAFIAPAELIRAGAVLFRDVPAQYGLGPTLAVAALCGQNCWESFHPLVASLTLAMALVAAVIALQVLPHTAGFLKTATVLFALLLCVFFWAGFPPRESLPTMAPSSVGIRFLPIFLLVALLVIVDRKIHAPSWRRIGHAAWLTCALWSPESAFYATFVWGPYYLWMRSIDWQSPSYRIKLGSMVRALVVLGGLLAGTVALFLVCFFAYYRTWPTVYGYLAYVLNEPALVNMSVRGVIWVMAASFLISALALWNALRRNPDTPQCRRLFITLCAAFAVTSIFVFRSHENNYLNILPMQVVMLLAASEVVGIGELRRAAFALIASTIAFVPIFGWEIWSDAIGRIHSPEQVAESFTTAPLIEAMSYTTDEGQAVLEAHLPAWMTGIDPKDARRAIEYITATYHEPVTMYDIYLLMSTGPSSAPWNAIQNFANFDPLPALRRREFLVRTAQRLHRPGWFIVTKKYGKTPLLDDMDVAYERTERLDFGTYYAIRYVPRALGAPASE